MHDVVIVGGGIAGASCAYFLAQRGVTDVILLEREATTAVHSTGRSASVLHRMDGDELLLSLKIQGGEFLRHPPDGFCEQPLIDWAGSMCLYGASWQAFQQQLPLAERRGLRLELLTPEQAAERVPVLEPSAFAAATFDPDDGNLDVHELLTSYLRGLRAAGGELRCNAEVTGAIVEDGRCCGVRTADGELRARAVVDAAGAWASGVATLAGATPIAIQPLRRCAVTYRAPSGVEIEGWPLVVDEERHVYFKPESGRLLMSPMDEMPVEPGDARPDDETIAAAIDRLSEVAPRAVPRAIERKWAGLRSFAPDRFPVVGEDAQLPGFFWLAGQGGMGIETSPALGAIAADLIAGGKTERIDVARLSPGRFG